MSVHPQIGVFAIGSRPHAPAYCFGTLVTDREQHREMRDSLLDGGFSEETCEFLAIDNTGQQQTDAYRGLNALLNAARAPFVILCHQDVRLLADGREVLDTRLAELTMTDPKWAVLGNAGGVAPGILALRITDPHGRDRHVGSLPAKVQSLDENFLIVRRDARIGFSIDLSGFHLYGADICLNAAVAGHSAYVIDFHIEHLSPGRKSLDFDMCEAAFRRKWSNALRPRWMQTTCTLLRLSPSAVNRKYPGMFERYVAAILRRLPRARGWNQNRRPQP